MTLAYLCRVNLAATTALPRDVMNNDFVVHFDTGSPGGSDFAAAEVDIAGFYTGVNDGVATLGSYMASSIDRGSGKCSVETFAIPDAPGPLGASVHSTAFTMPAQNVSGVDLPQEVAATLSFYADTTGVPEHGAGGTRPKARRRGRVFVGPLITASMAFGHGSGTP